MLYLTQPLRMRASRPIVPARCVRDVAVHGFQALIYVLPEKKVTFCSPPNFLGDQVRKVPRVQFSKPALDITMRFDEQESDPPCTYRA